MKLKGKEYGYLGRFAKEKYLSKGHNATRLPNLFAGIEGALGKIVGGLALASAIKGVDDPAAKKTPAATPAPAEQPQKPAVGWGEPTTASSQVGLGGTRKPRYGGIGA